MGFLSKIFICYHFPLCMGERDYILSFNTLVSHDPLNSDVQCSFAIAIPKWEDFFIFYCRYRRYVLCIFLYPYPVHHLHDFSLSTSLYLSRYLAFLVQSIIQGKIVGKSSVGRRKISWLRNLRLSQELFRAKFAWHSDCQPPTWRRIRRRVQSSLGKKKCFIPLLESLLKYK